MPWELDLSEHLHNMTKYQKCTHCNFKCLPADMHKMELLYNNMNIMW